MNKHNTKLAEQAQKRKAKLLREFDKSGMNYTEFAKKKGMSRQRMQELIGKIIQKSVRI